MIAYNDATIENLIFHRIGIENHTSFLSNAEYNLESDEEEEVLKKIFLKPFVGNTTTYEFKHEIELELNTLFKLARDIFNGGDFFDKSKDIHQHLKSVSKHPNIKDGDLFIVKYNDVAMGNKSHDALGIYKVENKETFIETKSAHVGLGFKKGIGTRRLDKACLILFNEEPFTVFVIDNGSTETDYWINDFINVRYRNDYVNSTNQFLTLTKSFITEQIPNEFEVNKADQIDLLNRSVEYFKTHETFEKGGFEKEVFQDNEVIDSFQKFNKSYTDDNDVNVSGSFEISVQAVKKQARVFKSILKLDKNFHIYIHGDRNLIEQGEEKDGRKFYKIYYKDEN